MPNTDLALIYSKDGGFFDLSIENGDFVQDRDLQTAVTISVLSDRRSREDDKIPNQEGWSADFIKKVGETITGSRLWLIRNEKTLDSLLPFAEEAARESLEWVIDNEIAENITVTATYKDKIAGIMVLNIDLYRPQGNIPTQFNFVWNQF